MSNKNEKRIEEIQKSEKITARLIIIISICVGALLTFVAMGLADYLF